MKIHFLLGILFLSIASYSTSIAGPAEDAISISVATAIGNTIQAGDMSSPDETARFVGNLARETAKSMPGCDSNCADAAYKQASNTYYTQSAGLSQSDAEKKTNEGIKGGPVTVIVTEKIPGANCVCAKGANCDKLETRKYVCEVSKGLTSFQNMIATIVRWVVNIILLLGVLAIVGAGIMMAWGSDSEEYTKKAKGWAINIVIGLIILFTFRYILGLLAPWIYQ